MDFIFDLGKIIIADIVLSGDNALVIAMAASGLAPHLRRRAIIIGMVMAALLRIIFALIATYLLSVPGLLFVGSLLLLWVCWELYGQIRRGKSHGTASSSDVKSHNTMPRALWSIMLADVSMSIDNVLAVAAIADGDGQLLIFGLALAILLMAFAATIIMTLLTRYPWISWLGLIVLLYVALEMFYRGIFADGHGLISVFVRLSGGI